MEAVLHAGTWLAGHRAGIAAGAVLALMAMALVLSLTAEPAYAWVSYTGED